jgi:hypothetical protein
VRCGCLPGQPNLRPPQSAGVRGNLKTGGLPDYEMFEWRRARLDVDAGVNVDSAVAAVAGIDHLLFFSRVRTTPFSDCLASLKHAGPLISCVPV